MEEGSGGCGVWGTILLREQKGPEEPTPLGVWTTDQEFPGEGPGRGRGGQSEQREPGSEVKGR